MASAGRVLIVDAALDGRFGARVPFAGKDSNVGAPEGSVTQSVANGIDGTVNVTEVIGEVPQLGRETVVFVTRR